MLNRAYIDLVKLRKNAINIKSKLPEKVLFNAVVKADGYGHGSERVANAIYDIVDSYSVALVEEGIKLRLSGIDKEILVLSPLTIYDYESVIEYQLTPTIHGISEIMHLDSLCERMGKTISCHVKYNTGMNRSGVDTLHELNDICQAITHSKHVKLGGMYSHLANPENKLSKTKAENKFLLANNLVKGYNRKAICHLSASGGFLAGSFYDMVRIGILLYGYKPYESHFINVEPIMKIYAPLLKTRTIHKGERALYGDKKADKDTLIGLVRYGYADGMDRSQSEPIFNNRCMDISAYKIKDKGTEFYCVMDNADKVAKENNTISYEILTKSAIRAEKIYIN